MVTGGSSLRGTARSFLSVLAGSVLAAQSLAPAGQTPSIPVEIVVVNRDGKVADGLTPSHFAVIVDGKPRRVLWVRYVSRGPGSLDEAARRLSDRTDTQSFAAEPARNVLVVVDEFSIQRGNERPVNQAAAALIDRLGLDDRVGVLRIPVARDAQLALTTDRPDVRKALGQVVGQAAPSPGLGVASPFAKPQIPGIDSSGATGDPDRSAPPERERPPAEPGISGRVDEEAAALQPGFLLHFQRALDAIRGSRGRTIIAILSAGFSQGQESKIDNVARVALAAHATIYAIGLPGAHDEVTNRLDVGSLERLARATGGTFAMLGKNAEKSFERVMPALAASYVLGIEAGPADADDARHTLRVETPRQALTIHAPGWLIPRSDVDDLVPPAPAAPRESVAAAPGAAARRPSAAPASLSPREIELQRLVARAADYVAGYEREYSLLVAEETYIQSTKYESQQIRSDLLLVRPERADGWVSFRDVYEVNGQAVRDRDDRLKRLFLDPSTEAQAQLVLIKNESARYNIGHVQRNINVPLFALTFLEHKNLWRFRFKFGGTEEVGGVVATRIDYEETGRPTLVRHNKDTNIAARGWFLIEPASGAITGSWMTFTFPSESTIEFTVKYTRDRTLGLWVPVEMKEAYSRSPYGSIDETVGAIDAIATYARFRRFQVKAETEIRIVK